MAGWLLLRHHHDSSGRMHRRGCGGSNHAAHSGSKRQCFVLFFLKGKLERWRGEKRTEKLNTASSKAPNNGCRVGRRQGEEAESTEKQNAVDNTDSLWESQTEKSILRLKN